MSHSISFPGSISHQHVLNRNQTGSDPVESSSIDNEPQNLADISAPELTEESESRNNSESESEGSDPDWYARSELRRAVGEVVLPQHATLPPPPQKSITKKRTYTYLKRIANPRGESQMRTSWKTGFVTSTDDEIKSTECCKNLRCF